MSWPSRPTRRRVLATSGRGACGLATSAFVTCTIGCTVTPPAPPQPDPLQALLAAALADAALASAVAAAHPPLAPAANALAADRRAHADALKAEVVRATPAPATPPPSTTLTAAVPPPDRAAARGVLVEAAKAAQAQAGGLVAALPRYRAGLVASVAACCASHLAVLG
jgi:hypothetical protein